MREEKEEAEEEESTHFVRSFASFLSLSLFLSPCLSNSCEILRKRNNAHTDKKKKIFSTEKRFARIIFERKREEHKQTE